MKNQYLGRLAVIALLSVMLFVGVAYCEEASTVSAGCSEFRDGDTVCFVGDSITHSGGYINIMRDYYHLVFPARKIVMINCGIAGDNLKGVNERFADDVLIHKPTVIYVMLGMNDIGRNRFGPGKSKPTATDGAVMAYASNLNKLAEKLKASGAREVVIMAPTMYDEYVQGKKFMPAYTGCDAGLTLLVDVAKKCAENNKWGFIDQHTPMFEFSKQMRTQEPGFTFLNVDRTHPTNTGHYFIASLILKAQKVWGHEAGVELAADSSEVKKNGFDVVASNLKDNGGEFTLKASGLPFVYSQELYTCKQMAQMYQGAAPRRLALKGLKPGPYELVCAGMIAGRFTAEDLSAGIDMNMLQTSPEYLQAIRVFSLDAALTEYEIKQVRNIRAARFFLKGDRATHKDLPENDVEAAKVLIKSKKPGFVTNLYRKLSVDGTREKMNEAAAKVIKLRSDVYAANTPIERKYELRAVAAKEVQPLKVDGGKLVIPSFEGVMVQSWMTERLKPVVNGEKLEISGTGPIRKYILLKWELPTGMDAAKIRSANIIADEAYAKGLQIVMMFRLITPWVAQAVNYYYAPVQSMQEIARAQIADKKWTFSGENITTLVRDWVKNPASNNGVKLYTSQQQAYGAINMKNKPSLVIEYDQ